MITSLKAFTKYPVLFSRPPDTEGKGNDIPALAISIYPNFRGSNKKKKRQSWKRNTTCMRCEYTPEKRLLQGSMYRRQLLLASTSLPLKPQQMMAAMPPPPNLTDYQKIANAVQEAEKLKNTSHGRQEIDEVVYWLSLANPLKHPSSKSPDELSGVVATPPAQEFLRRGINVKEVVTARVRRPEAVKLRWQDTEEQVVIHGIEVTNDRPLCFDVYIKLGQEEGDDEEELYAGTFSHIPPRLKQRKRHDDIKPVLDGDRQEQKKARRCCLRLGMNGMSVHRPLKSYQEQSVIVKLVPTLKVDEDPIKVESIFIEYT